VRSAVAADAGQLSPLDEVVGPAQPLLGPRHVVQAFTGVEQRAEDALDDREVLDVAAAHRGEGLVEFDHALVDEPGQHEHDAESAAGLARQIRVVVALGELDHDAVQAALLLEVVAGLRVGEQHPPAFLGVVARLVEQPPAPRHPPVRHRPLAVDPSPEPRDGAGRPGGTQQLALPAVGLVSALV